MPINYASQYAAALSQAYPNVLHYGAIYARKQEADYKWTSNHTIEVPTIEVTGRVDGSRTSFGARTQRHSNHWTPLTLRNHRMWNDFIHPRDIVETNYALSIQNITRVMNETQKFPEKDKYLISTLYADWLATGRVPLTATLTNENILTVFDSMMEMMTEKNVPVNGRILYLNPPTNTKLKGATNWYRTQNVGGNVPAAVQRALTYIDSVQIEEVPSDVMWSVYDFTVGAVKGVTAKKINMFLVHPTSVITPESYDFAQLDQPSAGSQGKYEYFEESFEDAFILPNKQYGIEFCVEGLSASTATYTTSGASGAYTYTVTAPTGTNLKPGTRYFVAANGTTALGYGEIAEGKAAWTEWNGTATLAANNMKLAVCDAEGRVYAISA